MSYAPNVKLSLSRRSIWLLSGILVLVVVGTLTWQRLALGLAFASAERRPSLLIDAQWKKPASAAAFRHRFPSGSQEADLLQWLAANHFKIDERAQSASRTVHSLPCNERVEVTWAASNGTIRDSRAVVSEAGCL
jgi:hypothetical protein